MRPFAFSVLLLSVIANAAVEKRLSFEEIVKKISPELKKQKELSLDKTRANRGYIKVVGPFDGRDQYFLFRGRPHDLVIHDAQEQSLELKQEFSTYLIEGGEIKKVSRSQVFPESDIENLKKRGLENLRKNGSGQVFENPYFWFDLPVYGRTIDFVVSSEDPNFYDNVKAVKATLGTLEWNGKTFVLVASKSPKIRKMSE